MFEAQSWSICRQGPNAKSDFVEEIKLGNLIVADTFIGIYVYIYMKY